MRALRLLTVFTLLTALLIGAAAAQVATASTDNSKPAANAWMLTPTPYLEWNKDISPSLRAERNKVWDEASMSDVPLTQSGSMRAVGGSYDLTSDPYDIAAIPNRAVVTATFTAHRSVLSESERSLYSEVTLHVDEVFEDRTGSGHLVANDDITLILYGGSVVLRNGHTFFVDNPNARPNLFIQPGHKYLFVLRYDSLGNFYEYGDSWDITDGIARASSPRALYLAQQGHSSFDGLSVNQLRQAVSKALYSEGSGR